MAVIKIPKGDQHPEAITPRTDMLGQVRDVVGPNMDRIVSLIDRTAKEKHANDIRLENIRISNKISKYESILADENEKLKVHIAEQPDVLNKKQLAKVLSQHEQKINAMMNKAYHEDDKFKAAFEGPSISALTDAKKILNDENTSRIFVEGRKSWDTFKLKHDMQLSNVKPNLSMWAEFEAMKIALESKIRIANKTGVKIDYEVEMAALEEAFWQKAVIGDNYRLDAEGKPVVDNLAILKKLTDEGPVVEDAEGNIISGKQTHWYMQELSDDMREKLIKYYDDESTKQHDNEIKVNARIISDNWKDIDNKIKTDSITVDDINQMNWPKTNAGDEAKKTAIGKVVLYKKGMFETESNVNELLEVRKLISENKIRNKFDKFWLPNEVGEKREQLKKLYGWNDKGGSINDRLGVTIGTDHETMIDNRLVWDETDRKNYNDFQRLVTAIKPRIQGVLKQHNLWSDYNMLKVELMIEDRFWEGIKNGKTSVELTNPNSKDFIFDDLDQYIPTIQEEAEQIAKSYTNSTTNIDTAGNSDELEVPDSMPKRDMKIFPNTPEGDNAWLQSDILQKWLLTTDGQNFLNPDVTDKKIQAKILKKDKIKKLETANSLVEYEAIELDIEFHLVPPRPDGFKGRNWIGVYKKENPNAVTLHELEKIVQKEKLSRMDAKPQKRGVLTTDKNDRIKEKILDGNSAYEKKDGVYYWKGTNIKVDVNQIK